MMRWLATAAAAALFATGRPALAEGISTLSPLRGGVWAQVYVTPPEILTGGPKHQQLKLYRVTPKNDSKIAEAVWMASWAKSDGTKETTTWADERSCPPLRASIAKLEQVEEWKILRPDEPPANFRPEDPNEATQFVLEVPVYFRSSGAAGGLYLKSTGGGPVARWVEELMTDTRGCWSNREPEVE